jgi:SOS-response transcriptional repressor LexA
MADNLIRHYPPRTASPPTDRQLQALAFIASHTTENGRPPTLREIGTHMGIASTNGVNDHLKALAFKGPIERVDLLSRGLRITATGRAWLGIGDVCPCCGRER